LLFVCFRFGARDSPVPKAGKLASRTLYNMRFIPEDEAIEQYDNMLDDYNDLCVIGDLEFDPSRVLEELDPIAYQCGFNDWLDIQGLTTDESECEHPDFEETLDCCVCEDCGVEFSEE